ncbi:MAG: ACP S-malonyltransferase [Firmicutes bacterium HGW-Firmicutes-21]|nr:MAG: ACP S-malonyltransferase [Firmicutes bacterium HGW-Firmicutes-21]
MGKIAFVFAGQGAQYSGMGIDLYENSPAARSVFDMAERLHPDTKRLCFSSDKTELSVTKNTQPALFAMDLACAAALDEVGIRADCAAGFSLGEVPAAAYCGLLEAEAAFRYVVKRGLYMHEAATENAGAMAAVLRLSNEQVEAVCAEFAQMYPVNYNCNGQVAIAGSADEMDAFIKRVTKAGGKAIKLAVSGAFHSPFMESASDRLYDELKQCVFMPPKIPLYSNVTAKPFTDKEAAVLMAKQVKSPVRWEQTVLNMLADGVTLFIEVGAGKVLSGLIKKISPQATLYNAERYEDIVKLGAIMEGNTYDT